MSNEQKVTSNEQKVMSNKQKVMTNEQKVTATSNERKVSPHYHHTLATGKLGSTDSNKT